MTMFAPYSLGSIHGRASRIHLTNSAALAPAEPTGPSLPVSAKGPFPLRASAQEQRQQSGWEWIPFQNLWKKHYLYFNTFSEEKP